MRHLVSESNLFCHMFCTLNPPSLPLPLLNQQEERRTGEEEIEVDLKEKDTLQ